MKKIGGIIVALLLVLVAGCTKVEQGKYKEGTYFGYDADSKYTAVIYVDKTGMIKSVFLDAAYGKKQSDGTTVSTTKQILGSEYGMKASSPIGKEWYEQANTLADKIVSEQGLTWLELKYRVTNTNGDYEYTSTKPDNQTEDKKVYTDSVAGVTMSIKGSYIAVENALKQATK